MGVLAERLKRLSPEQFNSMSAFQQEDIKRQLKRELEQEQALGPTGPRSMTNRLPAPDVAEGQAPFQHVAGEPGRNFLRSLGNVPHSLGRRAEEFGQVLSSPIETGQNLLKAGQGVGELIASNIPGNPFGVEQTEKAQMARDVGQGIVDSFDPEQLTEDPTNAAMNIATLLSGGAGAAAKVPGLAARAPRAASALSKAQRPLQIASDPFGEALGAGVKGAVTQGGRGINALLKKTAPLREEVIESGLGFTTGLKEPRIQAAIEAAKAGDADAVRKAFSSTDIPEDTANRVVNELIAERNIRGQMKEQYVKDFGRTIEKFDTRPLKAEMLDLLENEYRASVDEILDASGDVDHIAVDLEPSIVAKNKGKLQKEINKILALPDQETLINLDTLKMQMQDVTIKGGQGRRLRSELAGKITDLLHQDEGYRQANAPYHEISTVLERAEEGIGFRADAKMSNKALGKNAKAFAKALADQSGTAQRRLQELEPFLNTKVQPELVAQGSRSLIAKDLYGRSAFGVAAAGAAASLIGLGPGALGLLTTLPVLAMTSPQLVTRGLLRAYSPKAAKAAQGPALTRMTEHVLSPLNLPPQAVQEASQALQTLGDYALNTDRLREGFTVGQLMERVLEDLEELNSKPLTPRRNILTKLPRDRFLTGGGI